jgi:hypothetical protein
MISNAKRVAAWWSYRTRHQSPVSHVDKLWLEFGQHQPSSLMEQAFIQQEDNESIGRTTMGGPSQLQGH